MAIAPDGALVMCDKFGYVWRAPANASGGFDLDEQPVAHLGAGRPLGFHFDAEGGLVVAMAGAVRPVLGVLCLPAALPNAAALLSQLQERVHACMLAISWGSAPACLIMQTENRLERSHTQLDARTWALWCAQDACPLCCTRPNCSVLTRH